MGELESARDTPITVGEKVLPVQLFLWTLWGGQHFIEFSEVRIAASEPHENGFRLELNAPEFFHPLLNMVFQSQDVSGGRLAAVHDGQRMFARDPHPPAAIAPAKA